MALQTRFTTGTGDTWEQAYLHIEVGPSRKEGDKFLTQITAYIYKCINCKNMGMQYVKIEYKFDYNLESYDNMFIQAYNYLKSLPEYADSIDV